MAGSHPQQQCSSCSLILLSLPAPAMCSPGGASAAGSSAATDDRAFSPDLGEGERDRREGAAPTPQGTNGTAAALASEVAHPVKGGAANASEPTAADKEPATAGSDAGKSMLEEIAQLKKQQKEAKDARAAVAKQLRNAERRRKRLKQRASSLSDADLLAVISLRNHEKVAGLLAATGEGDEEKAKERQDDPGASSSSAAPSQATTKPTSKKPRSS